MADNELTIPIDHPRLKPLNLVANALHTVYFVSAASFGLYLMYVFTSGWASAYFLSNPDTTAYLFCTLILLALFGLAAKVLKIYCSDELLVSRDGLILPALFSRMSRVSPWLSWSTVTNAGIADSGGAKSLLLSFGFGKSLEIPLDGIKAESLEQFLLSIELWGHHCTRSAELIDYQAELHNKNKGLGHLSYTDMWNEELGRRFASTTFIPLEPGAKLQGGKLTVVRQLAFGGLSAIYLVQTTRGELHVLKEAVVPAGMEVRNQDAAEKALQREASILSQLNHQGVVQVLDHFIESDQHYLILQHVVGQDLRQMIRQNGAQSEATVLDWALQISSALEYLHTWSPPIIHRDLTPENIVLRNDGSIIIIDFGASNQFLGTMTGTIVGKQAYMAPEQLQGKASTQSDIYAFGGTLFFLLTGKDPVPLSESRPNQLNPQISSEFSDLVVRCTSFDFAKRPDSVTALREELMVLYSKHGIAKLFTDGVEASN